MGKIYTALGMMSGTSLDGIDAAIVMTDGETQVEMGAFFSRNYGADLREKLRGALTGSGDILQIERAMTMAHAEMVEALLKRAGLAASDIDVIGFHGQTIIHRPQDRMTWQIGDSSLLAELTGIDVVSDFRRRDMAAGGQGAPLVPLFHEAMVRNHARPVAILNIGGVSNVTWIGPHSHELVAFDTGPGNAMIDDWVLSHTGQPFDKDGVLARSGKVHEEVLQALLAHPFFRQDPPKSLDRNAFPMDWIDALPVEDGAATLVAFTAHSVLMSSKYFPAPVTEWFVTGGGRHNRAIMNLLEELLRVPVRPVEQLGFNGDAVEAQAYAYLAVRSLLGLPISFPTTTGVSRPLSGGVWCRK